MKNNLEGLTLVYEGTIEPERLGKIINSLYMSFAPSRLEVIQEPDRGEKYSNYEHKYQIYMPSEEYELNLGIC